MENNNKTNVVLMVTWYRDEEGNLLRDIYGDGIEQTAIGGLVSQLFFDVHAKGALEQSSNTVDSPDGPPIRGDNPADITPVVPEEIPKEALDDMNQASPVSEGPKDDPGDGEQEEVSKEPPVTDY